MPGPTAPASPDPSPDPGLLYPIVALGSDSVGPANAVLAALGMLDLDPASSPHVVDSLTSDSCGACHRPHTAVSGMLQGVEPPVASICFRCHDGSGSIFDVKTAFASSPYAHPATVDLNHAPGVADEFGGRLERHATCTDCHDAHNADGTLAVSGSAGWSASGAIAGASGVRVVNGAAGAAPAYTLLRNVTFEYQLCFKCHSGWTQLPAQDPDRPSTWALDKGIELNPANGSYHPIEAAGRNGTAAMTASLAGGTLWQFNVGSTIRCVNCHGDPSKVASGPDPGDRLAPHASTERGLLIAPYRDRLLKPSGVAYSGNDFTLCYLCHSEAPFTAPNSGATNFDLHAKHMIGIGSQGSGGTDIDVAGAGQGNAICAECHFRPHSTALAVKPGDVNNARLVNFAPNVQPRSGMLQWTGAGSPTCTLTCHGVSHNAAGYEPAAVQNAALGVDARISIAASGTNRVGDAHTFTVTVEQNDGSGWAPAVGTAVNPSEAGDGTITGGTCNDSTPGTNASGQCTIVVESSVVGVSTVNATATVAVDGVVGPVNVNVSTTGYGAHAISNAATWVDARISIAASATNQVDHPYTVTVTVEKNDGSGWVAASGVNVLGSLAGVGSIIGGTCDDSGGDTESDGTCTVIVDSSVPGTSTVDASAMVVVGGLGISVSTAGSGATATWVDARITIGTTGTSTITDPAVPYEFSVLVELNDGTGWAAADGIAVNPSLAAGGVGAITGGTCDGTAPDTGVAGTCTIVVESSEVGDQHGARDRDGRRRRGLDRRRRRTATAPTTSAMSRPGRPQPRSRGVAASGLLGGQLPRRLNVYPAIQAGATEHIGGCPNGPLKCAPRRMGACPGYRDNALRCQGPARCRTKKGQRAIMVDQPGTSPAAAGRQDFLTMGTGGVPPGPNDARERDLLGRLGLDERATAEDIARARDELAILPRDRPTVDPWLGEIPGHGRRRGVRAPFRPDRVAWRRSPPGTTRTVGCPARRTGDTSGPPSDPGSRSGTHAAPRIRGR